MIVGEAPGFWESQVGIPFVGKSGKVLQNILEEIGTKPSDIFVTNVVKHRPPDNRDPTTEELDACAPFIQEQIDLVQPKLIICVGKVPGTTMARMAEVTLPKWGLRGRSFDLRVRPIEVRITWHPAYVMRNPQKKPELTADLTKALADARARLAACELTTEAQILGMY